MRLRALAIALVVGCGGCMTAQTYDGPRRARDEVARIGGDLRISAGAPVSVILRQVDGRTLSVGESAVEVLPGAHTLLVDCRIAETDSVTRHSIEAEVDAGRRYRLVAQTGPGLRECAGVDVEPVD